jgi:hypothetical protein
MASTLVSRTLARASAASVLALSMAFSAAAQPPAAPRAPATDGAEVSGKLANGTRYAMHRPAQWNGVLVMNPDLEGRPAFNDALHKLGYATGNRARDVTNWQVREGSSDLVQLKALFTDRFSKPTRTIIIGGSLGGLVTRDAGETYANEFQGVIPTCGGGAGLIAMYNNRLDAAFALKTLLAPDDAAIELDHVTDDARNAKAMRAAVDRAMATPQGRAKLALIAAVAQLPTWPTNAAKPAAADHDAQLKSISDAAALILNLKADVEKAAGGAFSWNVGVDYRTLFQQSGPEAIALARDLYRAAGLDLEADLTALQAAPRRQADAEALAWARVNGAPTGKLRSPTFALFTAADPRAPLSEFRSYQKTVDDAGATALLRQAGVAHSGHCAFQGAERLVAVDVMDERLRTGRWPATTPAALNARAEALAAKVAGMGTPRFAEFPGVPVYPRQFGSGDRAPDGAIKR